MINATRSTLRQALRRWGRGIAGALLCMGTLAGMTLGTVAHAQVAFRSASSATHPVPTFRAANSGTAVVPAPVPAYVAAGAVAANAGAITPALPAGIAVDDILLLFLETSNQAITIANQSGGTWTAVANSPQSTGTAAAADATRLTVFWSRYNGTQTAPVTSDSGNHQLGRMIAVRGVETTGNPWDITAGGVEAGNTDTSGSIPGATTTVANTLVVAAIGTSLPDATGTAVFTNASWANASLTGVTERTDNSTNTGNGGGLGIATGVKATAGLYNATTVTTSANTAKAMMSIALRPQLTITITKPAGTIQNDVMIASFGFRTNQPGLSTDVGITPPAGWTLVRRLDNPGPTDSGLAVYRLTAGAAEPASYTWDLSCTATCATNGFQAAAGGITSFSNVNTTTPVDVENGQITAIGAQTAPSVTTTVANAMLVASHSYASAGPWAPPPASGGDAAMTEAVDILSGALSTEMSYVLHAAAGATAAKQATPTPDDDEGNAHILALRPALQSTITINKPVGTVQNDVMIASIGFSPNTLTIPTVPAGWTLVRRVDNANANANSLAVYRLAAGAAEPASYTWTFSAAGYLAGGILTFSGVDIAAQVDVENGNCTQQGSCATATLSHATPSVATAVTDTMLVTSHTYSSAGTWTPPGAMTEAVDVQHGSQSLGANYVLQAATGATGAKTAAASIQADVGNAHILALRPAAPPPPSVGGFNAYETSTAAGAIAGVIKTKIAGSTITLDMIALNAAKNAIETTFAGTVRVEVLNASDNSGALDANGCRPSWSVIQTLSPDPAFTDGRDPISFTQANSYPEARLRITFPAGAPTVTGCSNDNFAIRPDTFNNVTAQDATWETAGNARGLANVAATGGNVHKAGRPFRITAQAINGAGSPVATTNYSGSPTAVLTSLLQPSSGCGSCALGTLTLGTWSAASGVVTTDTASYNEAGSFAMRLEDQSFAAVDAGDGSSTAERYIVGPGINVGRFVPERFVLSSSTTPQYRTFNATDAACQPPPSGPRRSFTYLDQPFGYVTAPSVTITAERFGGGTTANYSGNLWVATLNGPTYSNNGVGPALDTAAGATNLTVNNDGTATLAIGGSLAYDRSATTPIAPFNANISITTDASNAAENAVAGNGIIGSSGALVFNGSGAGIAFDGGDFNLATDDGRTFVYGRARMQNASGPPGSDLPIPFTIEHYTGSQFVTNVRDHCTSFVAGNFLLLDHSGGITAGNMPQSNISTSGSIVAGVGTLRLLKPTSPPASPGRVRICLDLGADAATPGTPACVANPAAQSWLQGRWSETNYDDDPSATAAFGLYGQPRNFIFFRENY